MTPSYRNSHEDNRPVLLAISLILTFAHLCIAQGSSVDPDLTRIRHEWAMRYMHPGPHMELAKYYRDRGNPIQAFYILENARRYRFDQKQFDDAFLHYFGGFAPLDNSKTAETDYLGRVKASPKDPKILSHLADIYISRAEYSVGEPYLRRSFEITPDNFGTLMGLVELYERLETPSKGAALLDKYERSYPNSSGSYRIRLGRVLGERSPVARELVAEGLRRFPDDGYFWYAKGYLAMHDKDLDLAETSFVKAAQLDTNSQKFNAAAASFFRVERKDLKRAIDYYLKVYFLDPHAHFDGFAEAKVSNLNSDLSREYVSKFIASGKKAQDLLADPNPLVILAALSWISQNWNDSMIEPLLSLTRHDDVAVRYSISQILVPKVGRKLDEKLKELLNDADLRVRGVAIYMVAELWKDKSFPTMQKQLREEAQLLRYDAYSALVMYGGADGRKIVQQTLRSEKDPELRKVVEMMLAN